AFDGQYFREKTGPGCVCILPKGFPSVWRVNFTATILHLYFFPAFLRPHSEKAMPMTGLRHVFNGYDPLVEQIGRSLLAELQQSEGVSSLYVETLMDTLLIHLVRNYGAFQPSMALLPRGLPPTLFQQVKDHIQEHLNHDLTLQELAAIAGLSASYFSRQFKDTIGLSPHQYVIRMRVQRAEYLLQDGKLTIAEIARRVGFADQSHLSRHFRRLIGRTPGEVLNSKNVQK
ncbi:MAG TPA: AraC family transcriptional regulator, partial [Anaerolineales bacterium]|nr:AraC family transcriptional regulator [Anaerolineales bacterium]